MLKLEARPQASKFWGHRLATARVSDHGHHRHRHLFADGQGPAQGPHRVLLGADQVGVCPLRAGGQSHTAAAHRAWAGGLLSGQCVEHRCRGQFVVGAIAAGGVALLADKSTGPWIIPLVIIAGVLGGMLWAGLVALLRDRFNANEILVSLMLVYVAELVLAYLVYGPWKDPNGYNFPQTKTFEKVTQIPRLMDGSRVNVGLLVALFGVAGMWIYVPHLHWLSVAGGRAGAACGKVRRFLIAPCAVDGLLVSGGMAGSPGRLRSPGPIGQLTPYVPAGYGFAAIIVAFVGRLHPVGIVFRRC